MNIQMLHFNIQQRIAGFALRRFIERIDANPADDPYVNPERRDVLGESAEATILGPTAGTPDWWEAFDFRKPGHMAAWRETRRTGSVAFLDLEPYSDGDAPDE